MKTLVLAAAIVALAAPAAFAQNAASPPASQGAPRTAPKHRVADRTRAQSDVPDAIKTYVRAHAGDPFPYAGGEIQVGQRVDAGEVWLPIPDYPQYEYSNLAGTLVVIDKKTSKAVAVY
jgi:guanyl-specific ribonuclease Sa